MEMSMFSGILIVTLCAHTVLGFRMLDFLRVARQDSPQQLPRTLKSPVDAIVDVIRGELDSDQNGNISMAEVEVYVDRWLNPNDIQPFTMNSFHREGKGHLMALAQLIDASGDGIISPNELRRAAVILVNAAGDVQAGRIMEAKMAYNARLPSYSELAALQEGFHRFVATADSNKDGEISVDELNTIFGLRRFSWYHSENLQSDIVAADGNGDGNLNEMEALQFLGNMEYYPKRNLLIYLEIYESVGKRIADEWAANM